MSGVVENVVDAVRSVVGPHAATVPLHEPSFRGNEWPYVKECLDTTWVSSGGPFVDRFERALEQYTGVRRAVAVVNGTAALHVALLLADVRADDEVLVPALTFVATANAVRYCGAIPHFVDSDRKSLGVDPQRLRDHLEEVGVERDGGCFNRSTGRRIRAVVPMHTFGHPVDLDELSIVCDEHGIVMVEDAAESLGSFYRGRHTGNWGRLSAVSFNGNKIVTTGGGGAILTNDDHLADRAKHLTTTGKVPHRWRYDHDVVAYNYRLPNINAALGCAQLEQLEGFLELKRALADRYEAAFRDVPHVSFVREPSFARSNYWLNAIVLDEEACVERDVILETANDAGLGMRPVWRLMPDLPMYRDAPAGDLSTVRDLERRILNLPSSPGLVMNDA